jgi:fibronectin-binding autotransporter adhesin
MYLSTYCAATFRTGLRLGARLAAPLAIALFAAEFAGATITTTGNTTAAPAGGGTVAGTFNVGNTATGTLTITGTPDTPLTTSGTVTIGNTATGIGLVTLNGIGSNWTANGNFMVGDLGTGTVNVLNTARLITTLNTTLADNPNSRGHVIVNGLGSVWDSVSDNIIVGSEGTGVLEILAGGQAFSATNEIGDLAVADGRVTVSGTSSTWKTTGTLFVGQDGRGLLQILDGGRVQNTLSEIGNAATATGTVLVSGANSTWAGSLAMEVGVAGNGSLTIDGGGRISNVDSIVGKAATGVGAVAVRGVGSTWTNSTTLVVGEAGRGSLTIAEGGRVNSTNGTIGNVANSFGEVFVDGANSLWNIVGALLISDPGEANVTISNGGRIAATTTATVGAAGRLTLAGGKIESGGAFTNNGVVEGFGTIDANASNATPTAEIRLDADERLLVTGTLSNTGLIDVFEGEVEAQGAVTNAGLITGRDATFRFRSGLTNNGALGISFGTTDVFGDITNNTGRTVSVSGGGLATFYDDFTQNGIFQVAKVGSTTSVAVVFGAFSGSGGFTGGGDLFALGDLRPGQSPGQVTMDGNLSLGGTTNTFIELGGTGVGQFDQLVVSGDLSLAGTLTPSLINGFTLAANQHFIIASVADALTGQFAGLGQGALVGNLAGRDLFISYTAGDGNDVALFTAPALSGDFNGDGIVDAVDYTVWRNNLGDATENDINNAGDGQGGVDAADYGVWKQHYGNSQGSGSGGVAPLPVPEPSLIALATVAVLGAALCGRIRPRNCPRPVRAAGI